MGDAGVLTSAELALLLKIPTTVEQARKIKKRNELLLKALLAGVSGESSECPHCAEASLIVGKDYADFSCGKCAWNRDELSTVGGMFFCVSERVRFGGVKYAEVYSHLWLNPGYAVIGGNALDNPKVEPFIRGHIEWAEEVIRRGGVA